jgi:hypothetical protein
MIGEREKEPTQSMLDCHSRSGRSAQTPSPSVARWGSRSDIVGAFAYAVPGRNRTAHIRYRPENTVGIRSSMTGVLSRFVPVSGWRYFTGRITAHPSFRLWDRLGYGVQSSEQGREVRRVQSFARNRCATPVNPGRVFGAAGADVATSTVRETILVPLGFPQIRFLRAPRDFTPEHSTRQLLGPEEGPSKESTETKTTVRATRIFWVGSTLGQASWRRPVVVRTTGPAHREKAKRFVCGCRAGCLKRLESPPGTAGETTCEHEFMRSAPLRKGCGGEKSRVRVPVSMLAGYLVPTPSVGTSSQALRTFSSRNLLSWTVAAATFRHRPDPTTQTSSSPNPRRTPPRRPPCAGT